MPHHTQFINTDEKTILYPIMLRHGSHITDDGSEQT